MKIIKLFATLLFTIHYSLFTFSQTDSCKLRISLLTCSAGKELYAAWGHTAIRVSDSTSGMDMVLNYGTFDDSDPAFLAKFTQGIMIYALSAYPFSDFINEYKAEDRGVTEQLLSLSCEDKNKIYQALLYNARDENRFYEYYFSADNCTTRARDMVLQNINGTVSTKKIIPSEAPTFRNLIHESLDTINKPWSKLGIDLLLGSNLDKKVSNETAMFLPDYLMKGFDSLSLNGQQFVLTKQIILERSRKTLDRPIGINPLILFSLLAAIILFLTFYKTSFSQKCLNVFDLLFFLSIGLIGLLIIVLWIIRVDDVCRNNFNLLWALPTHAPVAFFLLKKKKWIQTYFRIVLLLALFTAAAWWIIPQQFNTAIAPLLAIIALRSWQRSK